MPYQPGDILLDKYRIESLLGQGAFGDVYRVLHLNLRTQRAIKVLRRDAPGIGSTIYANAQQRFMLEGQLGAKLHNPMPNPHLLQVYDFIVREDLLVLEMEYAAGGSLAERIKKQKETKVFCSLEEALQIAADVAAGLGALHAMDIVHRDIKPANILFDEHGHARLADLGLAQVPGGASNREKLSDAGRHPGTPGYMSPEQTTSPDLLKSPSDVYALGLMLFEMLTGRNYSLLRPGTHVQILRPEIPLEVDALLARMLAETPKERPWDGAETAGLLAEELGRLQHGQAVEQVRLDASRKAEAQAAQAQLLRGQQAAESRASAQAVEKARRETEQREQELKLAQTRERAEAAEQARLAQKLQAAGQAQATRQQAKPNNWPFILVGLGLGLGVLLVAILVGRLFIGNPAATPAPTPMELINTQVPTAEQSSVPTDTPTTIPTIRPTDIPTLPPSPEPTLGIGSGFVRQTDKMAMLYVPAGMFTMGSGNGDKDEKPVHYVTLDAYWIDQTEVTSGKYALCVQAGGCTLPSDNSSKTQASYYGNSQFADYPVINVDWNQANAYCEWAGGRLPTEAEWEKAARGTDGSTYPWGAGLDNDRANYINSIDDTTRVGSYESGKSPYGAYDMAGNVWEWVADWYWDAYYQNSPARNPTGPASGAYRVLRGGSWNYFGGSIRSANREGSDPSDSNGALGFRCARAR